MATVQGIREKVHLPIYDSLQVEPEQQLRDVANGSTLKFFVDVQRKNKLETNLQSASLLPHFNTFEARAMRVVISDLPPEFPDADKDPNAVSTGEDSGGFDVTDEDGNPIGITPASGSGVGVVNGGSTTVAFDPLTAVTADIEIDLKQLMEMLKEARDSDDGTTTLDISDGVTLLDGDDNELIPADSTLVENAGGILILEVADIETLIDTLDKKAPPLEQIRSNNGAGNVISKLVFNTVTTLFVGEKIMIEMPTWFFPGGAGPYSFTANVISHGEPTPVATFRFAEPIFIDRQQNFRVELDIPDSDVHKEIQKIYGPLFVWVVIDGYMTRDVQ
jgi:hypothetical protein